MSNNKLNIDETIVENDYFNNPKETNDSNVLTESEDEIIDVENLKKELETIKDKYTRICADYTNFRRRYSSEIMEVELYTAISLLKHFLPLLDSFNSMCFENANKENLEEGLVTLKNQLENILTKLGVTEIDTNETFNNKYHEAVSSTIDKEKENGEITKVYMKGYQYKDKILRPSMVEVVVDNTDK